jgi:putative cell wall-binding protein/uncharacterized protein YkwD
MSHAVTATTVHPSIRPRASILVAAPASLVIALAVLVGIPSTAAADDQLLDAQQLVYEINLARSDPAAFAARAGITMDPMPQPSAPLAVSGPLMSSAMFKAAEMAAYQYFSHQSPVTGIWPNRLARNHGYPLPSAWLDTDNNIESTYMGSQDAFSVLVAFAKSPGHLGHIFAQSLFFATHREAGAGRGVASNGLAYWAFHTAHHNTGGVFITGVVYVDDNGNGRMDRGEGIGGMTVTAGGSSAVTNPGGGYAIEVTPATYTVAVDAAGFAGTTLTVTVGSNNVLADFVAMPFDGAVRLAGPDRYATAVTVSQQHYANPSAVNTVVLARGTNFPDALAGAALAGRLQAPLLLTAPDALPGVTRDEIIRLGPRQVIVLGGTSAVSSGVVSQVAGLGPNTIRLSGSDRYGTAVAIAQHSYPAAGSADSVVVATGTGFSDALSAATLAVLRNGPVLLTPPDSLPTVVAAEIRRLGPDVIFLVGGEAAVGPAVFAALSNLAPTQRVAGSDRYATAIEISKRAFPGSSPAVTRLYATIGTDFPDALTASAAAAAHGSPVLLTHPYGVPSGVPAEVARLDPDALFVFGGSAVFSPGLHFAWHSLID